jgi:DTW domain-containing protein
LASVQRPYGVRASAVATPVTPEEPCSTCGRQKAICVCDRVELLPTKKRVLILQHPRERDVELGSAQLVVASLPRSRLVVGLSWRSLEHALDEQVDPARWAVIFPAKEVPEDAIAQGYVLTARDGRDLGPRSLQGVIVLDGSWSQAKTLWWRNPWLNRLPRLTLLPREPSIYGNLRREPRPAYLSTLESVADALMVLGEEQATREQLRRLFRTMVQRARDLKAKTVAASPRRRRTPQRSKRTEP